MSEKAYEEDKVYCSEFPFVFLHFYLKIIAFRYRINTQLNERRVFRLFGTIWSFMSRESCAGRMKVPYLYNEGRYLIALFCMLKRN